MTKQNTRTKKDRQRQTAVGKHRSKTTVVKKKRRKATVDGQFTRVLTMTRGPNVSCPYMAVSVGTA